MDTDTTERVVDTAEELVRDLTFPADKQSLPEESFRTDRTQNYAVKRAFQNVTNATIDIAEMVLVAEDETPLPETNRETIERLAARTGIGDAVSTELGRSAAFRNLLAHQYGSDIDDAVVYDALQNKLWVFREFVADVREAITAE